MYRLESVGLGNRLQLLGDNDLQIFFVDFFLLIGEPLEPLERLVELLIGHFVAELLQPLPERMAAGQLAHHQRALA